MIDNDHSKYESNQIEKCSILVGTSESLEMLSRDSRNLNSLTKNLKLVLVDGIEMLNDDKSGPYLEGFISRLKMDCKLSNNKIRYIAIGSKFSELDSIREYFGKDTKFTKIDHQSKVGSPEKVLISYQCSNKNNDFKVSNRITFIVFSN